MRYRFSISLFFFSLFFSPLYLCAQSTVTLRPEHDELRSLILQDIEGYPPIQRVRHLTSLADTLWKVDQKAALVYLRQAVSLSLDPATKASESERLDAVAGLFSTYGVLNRDVQSENAIAEFLRRTILNTNKLDKQKSGLALSIAIRVLGKKYNAEMLAAFSSPKFEFPAFNPPEADRKVAMDFAAQSLKGPTPASGWSTTQFWYDLQRVDAQLATIYFERLLEALSTAKNSEGIAYLLSNSRKADEKPRQGPDRPIRTDIQEAALYGKLIPFIKEDGEKLSKRMTQNCGHISTAYFRRDYYKSNFTEHWPAIEKAIAACLMLPIPAWKKPDFLVGKSMKTVEDYLEIAKSIDDPEGKANWVYRAAIKARTDKDVVRSIALLDEIDPKYRHLFIWDWSRVQDAEKHVEQLLWKSQIEEAEQVIYETPPHLQPRLILNSIRSAYRVKGLSEWAGRMLDRARTAFARMDFPAPSSKRLSPANPADYLAVVDYLTETRRDDEAVQAFEEFIRLQSLLSTKYTAKESNGDVVSYFNAGINKQFVDAHLALICRISGSIESRPIRLQFRLRVLSRR